MATTNQRNRSGGQKRPQGGRGTVENAAAQAADKVTDMRDDIAEYVSHGTEQLGRLTRGHEGQAVMIALAAGLGVGFVIGCSLATSNRRPKTWSDRLMAEGLGRKLMERVESMVPDAITDRFGR